MTTTEHDGRQAIRGASDVHWLGHLVGMAEARAHTLTMAAYDLRRSCDDKDAAECIFTALRRFEAALCEFTEYAELVTDHAVSQHDYHLAALGTDSEGARS